jgi:hypothetical protein
MTNTPVQPPIAGFPHTNGYDLPEADRLHVDSGIFHHLYSYVLGEVRLKHIKEVHAFVSASPRHAMLGRVASDMTQKGHINSSEAVKGYAQLLPVALLLLTGKLPSAVDLLGLFTGWHLLISKYAYTFNLSML